MVFFILCCHRSGGLRNLFMPRILIFANGILPDAGKARKLVKPGDFILCADGGTRHALELGLEPDLVIGDFDSLSPEERDRAERAGAQIMQYPHDKNETDLELAINHALELKPSGIIIVAALGNRLDQTLGNVALLSDPRLAELDVRLDDGVEEAFFCRGPAQRIGGTAGDIISLIPWGGAASGVRTKGLKWALKDETLVPDKTRGISNELLGRSAEVRLSSGLLFIIHRRTSNT
jgi:thiamine pyrophosphokinase